jgi:3-dehydroquinate dehydratase-2
MKTTSKGGKAQSPSARSLRKILVLHGPNLNLLGTREPQIYGGETLADIGQRLAAQAMSAGIKFDSFQSNSESQLIERIQKARPSGVDFIVINPAAFTHTSVALRTRWPRSGSRLLRCICRTLRPRTVPAPFLLQRPAVGTICGLGSKGYEYALAYAIAHVPTKN